MSRPNHLRLVAFNPEDYSLGSILTRKDRSEVSGFDKVAAALSLLFQFPDYSDAFLIQDGLEPCPIELNYDREERFVTELYIRSKTPNVTSRVGLNDKILIRFELFRRSFEFSTTVVAPDNDNVLIVAAPESLIAYQNTRMPRVKVLPEDRNLLPPIFGKRVTDGAPVAFQILELGVNAVKVQFEGASVPELSFFCYGANAIPIKFLREDKGNSAVFLFQPLNPGEYGAIFDVYRLLAYPHLKRRSDFAPEDIMNLYSKETGYLGKFETPDEGKARVNQIMTVWETILPENHRVTADYVTVDDTGRPAGASSAALGFEDQGKPVWVFHQLCARASPSLLQQSGELYTWRAEYLAGRPEKLDTVVWFDSKSRWLERIYVKFSTQNSLEANLMAVAVGRCQFDADVNPKKITGHNERFGHSMRSFADNGIVFGGIGPRYLNAARILDAVVSASPLGSIEDIRLVADRLLELAEVKTGTMEVSVPIGNKSCLTDIGGEILTDVDRFCRFSKDCLIDFLSSVEHSVAITVKKKAMGE